MILNASFNVASLFDADYLRNGIRYGLVTLGAASD